MGRSQPVYQAVISVCFSSSFVKKKLKREIEGGQKKKAKRTSFSCVTSDLLLCCASLVNGTKLNPQNKGGGGGWMEPLPGVFDMLQYFETILPLVESL